MWVSDLEKIYRDLVASEESLSFQCFVWDIKKAEIIVATLQDHAHVVCRQPSGLEKKHMLYNYRSKATDIKFS